MFGTVVGPRGRTKYEPSSKINKNKSKPPCMIPGGDTDPLGLVSGRADSVKIFQIKYAELPTVVTPRDWGKQAY